MSDCSTDNSSSDQSQKKPQPKKRGRKPIAEEDKKRIYHIKCPHCSGQFEWYHKMSHLKPDNKVTDPAKQSMTERNRIYHQRYVEKQKKLKQLEQEIEKCKCLLD